MKGAEKDAENLRHKQHMAKRVRTLAAELAQASKQIDAMKSACKGYADTVIRVAGERDDTARELAAAIARIEALHADLRTRTEERDAAQTEASKYAETRRLADDLQAELAAAKIALGKRDAEVDEWKASFDDSLRANGAADERAMMLADLVASGNPGAVHVAKYILVTTTKAKPCAP